MCVTVSVIGSGTVLMFVMAMVHVSVYVCRSMIVVHSVLSSYDVV
jgi:hypothetical protein